MRQKALTTTLLPILLCTLLASCHGGRKQAASATAPRDLPQLQDSGRMVALTLYSSTSYFLYRGQEMGFQYELAHQFAESLGLELEVRVARNAADLERRLLAGEGDLIAYTLPITKEGRDSLAYCGNEVITHQVIVQRQRGRGETLTDVTELIGKKIYVTPGKYYERLVNLNKELGGGILIYQVRADSIGVEDLIGQVARGEIDYTVADNDVARLNATYYPNLDTRLAISFDQRASWAVRRDCPLLAEAADRWQQENAASPAYTASMKRYFETSKALPHTPILSLSQGIISDYDALFKKYAPQIGWDWRLLASLAYKESNFDTTAVSWAGAKGLMQLMPSTAQAMGVPPGKEQDAEESVRAAVKYLGITARSFTDIPEPERTRSPARDSSIPAA